eukprot:GHVP01014342.1.p1 GENE.GHVP01014342.1~~GHVP01014342.1.p1  ORF type:complete len:341 (+),score=48.36 GHVP01014342.1:52-1023(+)
MKPNSQCVVTGGAGFVGTRLIEKLLENGHSVICVDSCITGRKNNIKKFLGNPDFEFLRHDIVTPLRVEADYIFHLASPASPIHYQTNRIKTLKTNVIGTINVLGMARQSKARVLFASTSEVYGEANEHPQSEEYFGNVNPVGPRSCYDEGKRAAEALCMDYHRQHGVDVRISRVFNTYGPGMDLNDGRVMTNFITQSLRGDDITICGTGEQTRAFCYIDDLIQGLILHMGSNEIGPINIGNPEEITINDLAKLVIQETGTAISTRHIPLPQNDPPRRTPNITKARTLLGWEPKIPLSVGLKLIIEEVRKRMQSGEFNCEMLPS